MNIYEAQRLIPKVAGVDSSINVIDQKLQHLETAARILEKYGLGTISFILLIVIFYFFIRYLIKGINFLMLDVKKQLFDRVQSVEDVFTDRHDVIKATIEDKNFSEYHSYPLLKILVDKRVTLSYYHLINYILLNKTSHVNNKTQLATEIIYFTNNFCASISSEAKQFGIDCSPYESKLKDIGSLMQDTFIAGLADFVSKRQILMSRIRDLAVKKTIGSSELIISYQEMDVVNFKHLCQELYVTFREITKDIDDLLKP